MSIPNAAARAAPGKRLGAVTKGRVAKPVRVVMFAIDKIGKSTWAANAPKPVFLGAEDGTAHLDVSRMPPISSWADLVDSTTDLLLEEHDFRTVVLDTADWAEPLCWAHVAKAHGKKSIEDLPYGKGYTYALDEWRRFLRQLDRLRDERGMNVIILAHSWIRTFKNPEGEDYDRFEMKLHAKAAGVLREWADAVLFANYETLTREENGRTKGVSTGARVIHTQRTAAWDAGNRFDLPEKLPLDWPTFAKAIAPKSAEELIAMIGEIPIADASIKARIEAAVTGASTDTDKLTKILIHARLMQKEGAR